MDLSYCFGLFEAHNFDIFLVVMAVTAVAVFIALHFVNAGYGIMRGKQWGPCMPNRIGWVVMEAPVFVAMCLLWWHSSRRMDAAPLVMFALFQLHYFQRSFIFPLLIRRSTPMPLAIIAMGMIFNTLNALMQGGWIFYVSPADRYPVSWLWSWQMIAGSILFLAGMGINLHSDYIIRHLRKPGDTRHYIPRGGMFRYVTSANYFGEFVEWSGFALLTWSWAGAVFALWTFANLAPRARALTQRYIAEFGNDYSRLHRRHIIPFIY